MTEAGQSPDLKEAQPLKGKLAVITGTSRGIGREIALSLARAGADIIGNHVDPAKTKRQEKLASEIREYGININSVLADMTQPEGRDALLDEALTASIHHLNRNPYSPVIDYLILNAAGGLEQDKPPDWPEKINIEAQLGLVEDFLPYMAGGVIVYVTSLWAHKYGEIKQLPYYEPVARTKNTAERELRNLIPDLEDHGVKLAVVCAHVVKGTAAHTLFTRSFKERMEDLEKLAEGGHFPEASQVGDAVRDLLISDFPSGKTVYIGGTEAEPIETSEKPQILNRYQIAKLLPMYGDNKLLVQEFNTESGVGKYTVRKQDVEGHFAKDFEEIKLFRGVDQIEAAAQALGLYFLSKGTETLAVPLFRGIGEVKFLQMIFPGEQISLHPTITSQGPTSIKGDCEIRIGDKVAATVTGIDLGLAPNIELAKKLIQRQKSQRQGPQPH